MMVTVEGCDTCGEDTALGGPLYVDRHVETVADGTRVVRCGECYARGRQVPGKPASDDDRMAWQEKGLLGLDLRQSW